MKKNQFRENTQTHFHTQIQKGFLSNLNYIFFALIIVRHKS
jgi:hypothetical protein